MIGIQKKQLVRALPFLCAVVVALSSGATLLLNKPVNASVSGWQAGNIMDDYVMTNKNTMTVSQIQSFLNSKVPTCDTNGQQLSEYGGPDLNGDGKVQRWEWGKANYNQTTFPCLKNYTQGGKTAAQIIYNAAQTYSINPQVLIVLLQKEQSLVTDTWPLNIQYKSATGYGCPDNAPCDSDYYGLTNQINWAAKMYRAIENNSSTWYTPYELGNNYIQYNPDPDCGGSTVYIQNRATQALYNYTPYQPNKAALDAGWGTVTCGAYGNRNFYLYFTSWFGSTHRQYLSLKDPRWMVLKQDVTKVNPDTGDVLSGTLTAGTQLRFTSKAYINGTWYLRTEYDTNHYANSAIPLTAIQDIPYTAFDTPRWMVLKKNSWKINPRTGETIQYLHTSTQIHFDSKIQVNGQTYFRTAYDTSANALSGVPASDIQDISYTNLETPRWMTIASDSTKVNPVIGQTSGTSIAKDTQLYFDTKILVNGKWYLRANTDTSTETPIALPSTNVRDIPYTTISPGVWRQTTKDTTKFIVRTSTTAQPAGNVQTKDTQLYFTSKIFINGQWYLRSQYDTDHGAETLIPQSALEAIPFVSLDTPRNMQLKTAAYKINTNTGARASSLLPAGTVLFFDTKAYLNGQWYLRSQYDTDHGAAAGIPLSSIF